MTSETSQELTRAVATPSRDNFSNPAAMGKEADHLQIIFGSFSDHFRIIFGSDHSDHFGSIGSFSDDFRIIFGSFSDHFRIRFGSENCQTDPKMIQKTSENDLTIIHVSSRDVFGVPVSVCRPH